MGRNRKKGGIGTVTEPAYSSTRIPSGWKPVDGDSGIVRKFGNLTATIIPDNFERPGRNAQYMLEITDADESDLTRRVLSNNPESSWQELADSATEIMNSPQATEYNNALQRFNEVAKNFQELTEAYSNQYGTDLSEDIERTWPEDVQVDWRRAMRAYESEQSNLIAARNELERIQPTTETVGAWQGGGNQPLVRNLGDGQVITVKPNDSRDSLIDVTYSDKTTGTQMMDSIPHKGKSKQAMTTLADMWASQYSTKGIPAIATTRPRSTTIRQTPERVLSGQTKRLANELTSVERRMGGLIQERAGQGAGTFDQVAMRRFMAERMRIKELQGMEKGLRKIEAQQKRLATQVQNADRFKQPSIRMKLDVKSNEYRRAAAAYIRRAESPISDGELREAQRRIDTVVGMVRNATLRGRPDIMRELTSESDTRRESGT